MRRPAPLVTGTLRRGGTRGGTASSALGALVVAALAWVPVVGYLEALALPLLGARLKSRAPKRYAGLRISQASETKKTRPDRDRRADAVDVRVGRRAGAPLSRRARQVRRATSVFPSLTPVCLSSIATGEYPDVHEIPHLVWWHRGEQRLVEYGSSFGAVRAAGISRSLRDTVFEINRSQLSKRATTVYEALEDEGFVAGAINITCYRGRTRHLPVIPGVPAAYGPKRFFYYSLFESEQDGCADRHPLRAPPAPSTPTPAWSAAGS